MLTKQVGTPIGELVTEQFPAVEQFLGPWLTRGCFVLLVGSRGSGKTWFSQAVAQALGSGSSLLKWSPLNLKRVCYIDGEMGRSALAKRFKQIDASAQSSVVGRNIQVVTLEDFNLNMPNLSDPKQQADYYEPLVKSHDVTIIDNLLTCSQPITGRDDEVSQWRRIAAFFRRMKQAGKAIILVHHTTKSGLQYGTILKENDADTMVNIRTFEGEDQQAGCAFALTFDKHRHFEWPESAPLYVTYKLTGANYAWSWCPLEKHQAEVAKSMKVFGSREPEISEKLGVSQWRVKELLNTRFVDDVAPMPMEDDDGIF